MTDDPRKPHEMVLDASRCARGAARDISRLANAFATTGNDRLAAELDRIADALDRAADDAQTGAGRMVYAASDAATRATGNVIAAAMAGIALGGKSREAAQ